jgi:hypothetical protein
MLLLEKHVSASRRPTDDGDATARPPRPATDDRLDQQSVWLGYGGVLIVLIGLFVACATVFALSSEVRHAVAMSFVRQPQHYTELYFSRATPVEADPPAGGIGQVVQGPLAVSVFFTVVNHEGQATTFPYELQVTNEAGTVVGRADGSVEVSDGSRAPIWATVDIPAGEQWSRIDVGLVGREEHIRFLREE